MVSLSIKMIANTRGFFRRFNSLYNFTKTEQSWQNFVRKFVKTQLPPTLVTSMDHAKHFDPPFIGKLFSNNLLGIEIPKMYEGAELNYMCVILANEEIAKIDPSVSTLVWIHNTLPVALLRKLGTPEQKAKYLPKLAQEYAGSFCLSEPGSGSDAFSLKTTATKCDGEYFVLNGSKAWISNSDIAGMFVVFANVDPALGYKGVTAFIVERDSVGFSIGKPERKLGIRASGTCPLTFDNCKVHKSQILGEIGHGYKYAAGFLNESRIAVSSQLLGLAQGCLDLTVPLLLKDDGGLGFDSQAVQHQVANIAMQIEAARLLVYNAARLCESGKPFLKEASMAKLFTSELAQVTAAKCIDLMSDVGGATEAQKKFYRDSKIGTIYEGASNMQLNTIAKAVRRKFEQ